MLLVRIISDIRLMLISKTVKANVFVYFLRKHFMCEHWLLHVHRRKDSLNVSPTKFFVTTINESYELCVVGRMVRKPHTHTQNFNKLSTVVRILTAHVFSL